MGKIETLAGKLQPLLKRKVGKAAYASILGVTIGEIEQALSVIKNSGTDVHHPQGRTPEYDKKVGYTEGSIQVEGYYDHPPRVEEIIESHQIDTKKWKLASFWSVQKGGKWRVSALFSPLPVQDNLEETIKNLLKNYKPTYVPKVSKPKNNLKSPCSLLLSLPDLHLDKLTLDKVSADERSEIYLQAIEVLAEKATSSYQIEEIVFVVGNDYLHTDSFNTTTTKGTPLTSNISWEEAYEKAFDTLVKGISHLRTKCNKLKVILVQGNHARTKEYYLTHAVEVFFKKDKGIEFQRDSSNLKVHKYGETLLCFSHGDNVNDKLPLIFATSFYKEWGQCKYKEILLADKHHNSEKLFKSQGEVGGVRMRILPSLGGTDVWHQDNLYIGAIQAGIALVYDKKLGKIGEFEHRI